MASTSAAASSPEEMIKWLAEQRRHPERRSAQVVEYGTYLLEKGYIKRMGDELWALLEQVAVASLDVGDWDLAELCLARLNTRFPKSSRVGTLQGMLYEARGEHTRAFHLYGELIEKADGADIMLSRRRVAVLKSMDGSDQRGGIAKAIEALVKHLEVFYSDPEGWQELASLYLEHAQYAKAISALEELMLLVPQNGFFVLQYAEALYTTSEYSTAYKAFLRVLDMGGLIEKSASGVVAKGPEVRALWGLKATIGKLRESPKKGTSGDIKVDQLDAVEQLVKELLNRAYGPKSDQATAAELKAMSTRAS
ncbi:TPR-like protein [Microstroma glucosiphilum]|uniref:ER membrane protein complex subunit 2 n=1 Tax=Pseudomicrostroma glucosiphilum TaxID=1684307 RepID=A0A316U9D3_9BASI|nr:TPR-like protein [Pseudomicrostroma glucosiphilum]PWN19605.1 TPR-like protein [Pseudomicrostroma glucosiphilum]